MKSPLPFEIPKSAHESFRVQVDRQSHFYDHLHSHPEIQLTMIVKSEGIYSIAHQVGNFTKGDMYLIGGDVPHVFRNGDEWYLEESNQEAHSISLFFRKDSFGKGLFDLPEFFPVRQMLEGATRGVKLGKDLSTELKEDFLCMPRLDGATRVIALLSLLNKIATQKEEWEFLSPEIQIRRPKEADFERLDTILHFILENYQQPISLEEAAEKVHLTTSAFCRFFKKRTRKSFVEYLNEFRVSMACKLLMESENPVGEICYQVGFNNLANFNRQFRKATQLTPSQFRKVNKVSLEK